MRKRVLTFCTFVVGVSFVLSFVCYAFLPDKLLYQIALWQLVPFSGAMSTLFLLMFPLSAFRQLRPFIQPGFTVIASLLFICLLCVCPFYVNSEWGWFWSYIGFSVPIAGCALLGLLAALFSGNWLMLIVLSACVIGCISSSMASLGMLEEKAGVSSRPRQVDDASNAIWAMLSFVVPFGLYSNLDARWLCLMLLVIALAVCVRKGHRWAYIGFITLACAYCWLLVEKPGALNVSPTFRSLDAADDVNRHINTFGKTLTLLLKINGMIQHLVVAYATLMLLTPSATRWFWQPKIKADPAGLRLDKDGRLIDERGNLLDRDRNLEFPLDETK